MADPNADRWTVGGAVVAVNPDTVEVGAGLSGSYAAGTLTLVSAPLLKSASETVAVAAFTDNTDATGTFETSISIPAGAIVDQVFITDVTGFAGDTSAVITVGDGTDVDRYNTGTPDVFTTAAHVSAGVPSGTAFHSAAKTVTLIITGAADFTSIVTEGNGALTVTVLYKEAA